MHGKLTAFWFGILKCFSGVEGWFLQYRGQYRPLPRCLCCQIRTYVFINFFEAVASLLCYLCNVRIVIIGLLGRSCATSRQCVWSPKLLKAYRIFVFDVYTTCLTGRCSEIRIATCYGLGGAGIGSRWARNFALFQTGPPSLLCSGYRVSFPEVKRPGHVDHPPSN